MIVRLISAKQIADRLEVSSSWIYSWTHKGLWSIPHVRIGRFFRYDLDSVLHYLKKKKRPYPIVKRFPIEKINKLFPPEDFSLKRRPKVHRSVSNARRRLKRLKANKNVMAKYIAGDIAAKTKMTCLYQAAYPEPNEIHSSTTVNNGERITCG